MEAGRCEKVKEQAKIEIIKNPNRYLGFSPGDIVNHNDLGDGVVVGFSSYSSEPFVFFYTRQESVCVGFEFLALSG